MVKHEWIVDDNAENIIPVFNQYEYDKGNPGVYIEILKENIFGAIIHFMEYSMNLNIY